MSSNTPRLGLKKPDGSDPFLRQDYVDLLTRLDTYPGDYICTSASRPSWGPAQAGQRIYETDTHSHVEWTGTAWTPVRDLSPVFAPGTVVANTVLSTGANGTFTLGTITVNRPCVLQVLASVDVNFRDYGVQGVAANVYIDGVDSTTYRQYFQQFVSRDDIKSLMSMGSRTVAAGNHVIALNVGIGGGSAPVSVTTMGCQAYLGAP